MSLRSCLLALALVLVTPAVALGQRQASDSRDTEARSLFEAGRSAFQDGRFEDARVDFSRAYELSGRPELLYNLASAEDRLRDDAAALEHFEAYLREVPDASNRAEVEGRIAVLRSAVAARTGEDETRSAASEASHGPTVLATWILGGLALATGGLATGFWVAANDQYRGLEQGCLAAGGCTSEEIGASGVETSVTLTNTFLVTSLVLAAGTATALALELTLTTPSDDTLAALQVSPTSLGVRGQF